MVSKERERSAIARRSPLSPTPTRPAVSTRPGATSRCRRSWGPPRYDSLPDRIRDALSRERDRVLGLHPADPEAVAADAWIEVIEGLPWRRRAEERLDASALRRALDREHVGREREKDQALDYLMARHAGETTAG